MIEFTFENDEIRNYALTYENVPDFSEVSLNSTTRRTIQLHIWSGEESDANVTPVGDGSDGRFIFNTLEIELVIRPVQFAIQNSDIAYDDWDPEHTYVHEFDPYCDYEDSVFGSTFPSTTTYYVGGTYIKLSKWTNQGDFGDSTNTDWKRIHSIYYALGTYSDASSSAAYAADGMWLYAKDAVGDGYHMAYEYDWETERLDVKEDEASSEKYYVKPLTYRYNSTNRTYKLDDTVSDEEAYIFVYVVKQTLNVEWDHTGVAYTYKGGIVYTSAKVSTQDDDNKTEATIRVPIRISNAKAQSVDFASTEDNATTGRFFTLVFEEDTEGSYVGTKYKATQSNTGKYKKDDDLGGYVKIASNESYTGQRYSIEIDSSGTLKIAYKFNKAFDINPYDSLVKGDFFERISNFEGTRYAKQEDGTFKEDEKGAYKKVDDEYVELSYAELGNYKYFPNVAKITLSDGREMNVPVQWDFSGVNVSYAGGAFTALAYINNDGGYDYERADGTKNEVGAQKVKVAVNVQNGTVQEIVTSVTNAGSEYNYNLANIDGIIYKTDSYINPYEYVEPTMPNMLRVKVLSSTNTIVTKDYKVGAKTNSLTWNFSTFRPTYQGGVTNVTALLVGEDGSTQKLEIPFRVFKMEVKKIASSAYTTNITNGYADTNYTINPYDGTTLALPTSYTATFATYKPTLDGNNKVTGFTATTDKSKTFSYVIVSMPTALTWDVTSSGITSEGDGKEATIQFANQERIGVKLAVASTISITSEPSLTASASTLTTKVTISGKSVPVAWYGTATVYATNGTTIVATYNVTFSSNASTMAPTSVKGRKIVYNLKAYVGTVVNKNGNVVSTTKVGDADVPVGQYVTGNKSITVNG